MLYWVALAEKNKFKVWNVDFVILILSLLFEYIHKCVFISRTEDYFPCWNTQKTVSIDSLIEHKLALSKYPPQLI